jgi:sarcosine oxidase subunit beta
VDEAYLARMRSRLNQLVPVTAGLGLRRVWAATIEYTPDHLPIAGPALGPDGSALPGVFVATAAGHGMMCGPGVARTVADLVLTGFSDVVDTAGLGLDRFDEQGRSKLSADPIALPFPEQAYPDTLSIP